MKSLVCVFCSMFQLGMSNLFLYFIANATSVSYQSQDVEAMFDMQVSFVL